MGLLSKLIGNSTDVEKMATNLLGSILNEKTDTQNYPGKSSSDIETYTSISAPSGKSWGDIMPAEENQFNYNGTYTQYFESIFSSKLASYVMSKSIVGKGRTIYTFSDGTRKVLLVELMPESSSAKKIRLDCQKEGIRYLRFYYNHHGWWNTRSYVEERIEKALR